MSTRILAASRSTDVRCRIAIASSVTASFLALLLCAPPSSFAAGGGGGGGMSGGSMGSGTSAPAKPKTPEELAQQSYERGLKHRDRALGYEEKARVSDKSWFGKLPSEKAVDQWREAVEDYEQAIEKRDDFYEAHSDLGFARRKLGEWNESLEAYDRALALKSDYSPAIEYRGEAYLKLGRLSDAKDAYMRLFTLDRPLADQLMGTMKAWIGEVGEEPVEGLSGEELTAFRAWVEERAQLASQAGSDVSDARSW